MRNTRWMPGPPASSTLMLTRTISSAIPGANRSNGCCISCRPSLLMRSCDTTRIAASRRLPTLQHGIRATSKIRFKVNARSHHDLLTVPNLLGSHFTVDAQDQNAIRFTWLHLQSKKVSAACVAKRGSPSVVMTFVVRRLWVDLARDGRFVWHCPVLVRPALGGHEASIKNFSCLLKPKPLTSHCRAPVAQPIRLAWLPTASFHRPACGRCPLSSAESFRL